MIIKHYALVALLCLAVVASLLAQSIFLYPAPVYAQPGIMRWETVTTPNSEPGKNDVLNPWIGGMFTGSEIRDLSVGNDGVTLISAVTVDARYINPSATAGPLGVLMKTSNGGISWSTSSYLNLTRTNGWTAGNHVYNVVIAPDDSNIWMISAGSAASGPVELWLTVDGGASWSNMNVTGLTPIEAISSIDISKNYGDGRDYMFGTRSGNGAGRLFMLNGKKFGVWAQQAGPTSVPVDYYCVKFSPMYDGDGCVVVILADNTTTYYNVGVRDINANNIGLWVFNSNGNGGVSIAYQSFLSLSGADLSLPSDFSGQASSLRRAFVSLVQTGIYRIDDAIPAQLLSIEGINSIAFFGTYAQGKLLAGSLLGSPCYAVVPTLFMDTPCTCAGSCGYKPLKPPTGAANQGNCGSDNTSVCSDNLTGVGSAVVAWSPDGSLAYAVTGSGIITNILAATAVGGTYVDATSATLTAKLTSLDNDTSASVSFEYGLTPNYGSTTAATIITPPLPIPIPPAQFSATATGLTAGNTYHFRAKVVGIPSGVTVYSPDATYVHDDGWKVDTGSGAYSVADSATFSGNLLGMGDDTSDNVSFEYGPTTTYGSFSDNLTKTSTGSFSINVSGLTAGNTYHFRARSIGIPSGTTVYGSDVMYTHVNSLSVSTGGGSYASATTATLTGSLSLRTDTSATVYFDYGFDTTYGSTTAAVPMTSGGSFSATATSLAVGNFYHFRARAVGAPSGATVYGTDLIYYHPPLTAFTTTSSYISPASASLNGLLFSLGTDANADVSLDYVAIPGSNPWSSTAVVPGMSVTGFFTGVATGLAPRQAYIYRAKALGHPSSSTVTGDNMTYINGYAWWSSWINKLIPNDESAFSISRNNGDTWNQLSLIDTATDWFNDVAVSADCTTVYLASVHRNTGVGCNEFDSVWRSTTSPGVSSPLPASSSAGVYWERVLCHTTSACCRVPQTDLPLLRTATSCTDSSDGGIVGWAAQYAPSSTSGSGLMAWSPDYGDYWIVILPRNIVQDFTFDGSRTMYTLSPSGKVQKLVFTGTAWTTSLPSSLTNIAGHTIAARNGRVLVGAARSDLQEAAVAYSADGANNWVKLRDRMPVGGDVHVIFDVDFDKNNMIYAAVDDNTTGTVYRNTVPSFARWDDNDMMDTANGAWGPDWWNDSYNQAKGDPPHRQAYYGIVQAFTGNSQPALYAAHDNVTSSIAPAPGGLPSNSAVCRTLEPRNGLPKPGMYWDCLDIFAPSTMNNVHFTLEPSSLKACGCCSPNTSTTLWAIDNQSGFTTNGINISDNSTEMMSALAALLKGRYMQSPGYNPITRQGMLWAYTDCLAKKGPALRGPADQALVGADPVTGRNQQVDLSWEQLCLSTTYELQVAKDKNFSLRINPQLSNAGNIRSVTGSIWITMDEVNMTNPSAWLAPGSLPESGSFYYWRVRSYQSATRQIAASPWSEIRSFRVKPGFIVASPYLGVQLLSPNNGCMSCKVKPASFSWSPWKEATRYEFALSRDPEFKQVVESATTGSTGYEYMGTLEYDTNYFWHVRAVEINGQAIPSDWSATFSFKTEPAPAPPEAPASEPATPLWVWFVIGLGVGLSAVVLVFIVRTRS